MIALNWLKLECILRHMALIKTSLAILAFILKQMNKKLNSICFKLKLPILFLIILAWDDSATGPATSLSFDFSVGFLIDAVLVTCDLVVLLIPVEVPPFFTGLVFPELTDAFDEALPVFELVDMLDVLETEAVLLTLGVRLIALSKKWINFIFIEFTAL